jgi:4-aminobutyrate aminotransferase-like enzyme
MAPAYASEPKSQLAKLLVEAAGADTYKRVFFTNAGAESNENAMKMARMSQDVQRSSPAIAVITEQLLDLLMHPETGDDLQQRSVEPTDL